MYRFLSASVVAIISFAVVATLAKRNAEKKTEDIFDEDNEVFKIIDSSVTLDIFVNRYANWCIEKRGSDVIADAYYITTLRKWGVYTTEMLTEEACSAFDLSTIQFIITDRYEKSIEDIIVMLLEKLVEDSSMFNDRYHYFSNIAESVTWERIIPDLEKMIKNDCDKQDYAKYERDLQALLTILAIHNQHLFNERTTRLLNVINCNDISYLSGDNKKLHAISAGCVDRIENIINNIQKTYLSDII